MFENLKRKVYTKKRFVHKNIDFLLEKLKIDASILSAETGIPAPTICRMRKEDNNPTLSSLEPVADFFRVEINDLLYEDMSNPLYREKKKEDEINFIPIITLNDIEEWPVEKGNAYIETFGKVNKDCFGITIPSDSLSPIFFKNSIVIIDPHLSPKDTDYVFCLLNNKNPPLLRQILFDGKTVFFKPINPKFGEMVQVKNFTILGVVIKSIETYR